MKAKHEILGADGWWRPITEEEDEVIKGMVRKDLKLQFYQTSADIENNEITVTITETIEPKP